MGQQIALIFTTLLLTVSGYGFTVSKSNNTGVVFSLDGATVTEGQELYVIDANNVKKLLVKVKKFNSTQALADITKGNPKNIQIGFQLIPTRAVASVPADGTQTMNTPKKNALLKPKNSYGFLASYMMNNMNAKFSYNGTNQTAAMTGSAVGALGFYDYSVNRNLTARVMGGMETFQATQNKDTAVCGKGTTTTCDVKISYFSMYGMGKYNLTKDKNKFWIGGGLGYLLATGKSSTVLDTSMISSNQVLTIGAGMDIGLGKNMIPVALDYSLFPSSSTVSASIISLKFGFGLGL